MSKNAILVFVLVAVVVVLVIVSKITPSLKEANTKPAAKTNTVSSIVKPVLDREIDINDVVIDPPVYSDLTLTLDGKINNWVTKNTFTITPPKSSFGSSGKSLPVISRDNYKLPDDTFDSDLALGEIANIRVTGKIVIFDRATLEQEWAIDLNDKELDRWNKTPVMLLDKIEKL